MRGKKGYVVIMSKTTTLTDLAAQVEELTKIQNRIREVIRANSISSNGLDPKGIIEMSDSDYAEHRAALQKVSDEFDERKKVLAGLSVEELEQMLQEVQIQELCDALSN